MTYTAQAAQMTSGRGFIAALDQSGGSTPNALRLYGVDDAAYGSDADMFDLIHAMRSRIAQAPAFRGDKVIAAILFEHTMDRQIAGKPAPAFFWQTRGIVPFLKIDKGLQDPADGVRLMRAIPDLDGLLDRALAHGIFGTKARSVIDAANEHGIETILAQQFDLAAQVLAKGLTPILEPEVTISIHDKASAENLLLAGILRHLDALPDDRKVMIKLALPSEANFYAPLIAHPKIMRVVALSGGYTQAEALAKLSQNTGMIASFSRALTQGLSAGQSDADFNATLGATIDAIYTASTT
jgi:fructose-bisphosphate aldolase class I